MASNRHLGRIVALQTLYEYEFRSDLKISSESPDDILERNLERYDDSIGDKDFVSQLIHGVISKSSELDDKIAPLAPEWPLSQISRIDRVILRMGVYELLYESDKVPPKVVINESIELAKSFGSDNSSKFVNGVLGSAYRALSQKKADSDSKAE